MLNMRTPYEGSIPMIISNLTLLLRLISSADRVKRRHLSLSTSWRGRACRRPVKLHLEAIKIGSAGGEELRGKKKRMGGAAAANAAASATRALVDGGVLPV
jgi:hypothetical protein